MSYLIIKRPRPVLFRQMFNLVLMVAVSAYFLYVYQSSGWTYDIVSGVIFAVWACYILWHILSRPVTFEETEDGFKVHRWFRLRHFRWAEVVAKGEMDDTSRIVFLVLREQGATKDTYLGVSRRVLGDGFGDVVSLIHEKRPDAPLFAQGQIQQQIDTPH